MHAWTSKKKLSKTSIHYSKAHQMLTFSKMMISISSHIRCYTRKKKRTESIQLFSFTVFHPYTKEKKRENWLNKIIEMYISLFTTMNGIELSIVLLIFFQLHYREKRKEKKKLLTSYDFGSSMKIDWNKTIIEHICISFDRLYSMDIFRWE